MSWEALLVTVFILSLSGVLAPGPLFFAAVSHGLKNGAKSGILIAIGHTLFELPLVLALASGLLVVVEIGWIRLTIGTVGSMTIMGFGLLQVVGAIRQKTSNPHNSKIPASALLVGLGFTALNPLFIVWWLTVGMKLIMDALVFASIFSVLMMYAAHVWMDYLWLAFVAHISSRASRFISETWMRILMISLGSTLVFFGAYLLVSSVFWWVQA